MTQPVRGLDVAATSWRDFTQANPPPSSLQRAVARFCDRFVSAEVLARVGCLRRVVEACRGWQTSEAAFRERFVERTLCSRASRVPLADLSGIVDRLAPRLSAVDDLVLSRIIDAALEAQARQPLPVHVEAALGVISLAADVDALDRVEAADQMPGMPRDILRLQCEMPFTFADHAMHMVRHQLAAMTDHELGVLTAQSVQFLHRAQCDLLAAGASR